MLKVQLAILTLILGVFGIIFWFSQQNSISQFKGLGTNPGISLPPDNLKPIATATPQPQQQQQLNWGVEEAIPTSASASIRTSKGTITVTLYGDVAPQTVKNFIQKSRSDYYKNLTFHRVEDWVVQGGDPRGNGTGGGQQASELNDRPFVVGSLGVARTPISKEVSNDSQFFITKKESPHLNNEYTNFGIVTSGMNVVNLMKPGDKILGITVDK